MDGMLFRVKKWAERPNSASDEKRILQTPLEEMCKLVPMEEWILLSIP